MRTALLLSVIFLLPIIAISQINSSIDIIAGIEYSNRALSTATSDVVNTLIMEDRNDEESGKLNWRFGFNYNRKVGDKIFLKTGLRLASVGYNGQKNDDLRWPSQHDGNGGFDPSAPNAFSDVQFVFDYWFVEVPIVGRYHLNDKKLSTFFEIGVAPSVYLTTRTKTITDTFESASFRRNNLEQFKNIQFVGLISAGMNYNLNEGIQIFGQPIIRYHLTNMADSPIKEYLFNYGVELGVRKKLN